MGLTVLASPDPLLALLSPPGAETGDAAPPDAFQALLAELLGGAPADPGAASAADTETLSLPPSKTKDESPATSAAVLEAMAALQPLAAPLPPAAVSEHASGSSDSPISGIGTEQTKAQPDGLAPVAESQAELPADSAEPNTITGGAGSPATTGQQQAAAAPNEIQPASTPTLANAAADLKAVLETRSQELERHEKRAKDPDDAPAPPGDPPTNSQPAASVVRSVGNAHENKAENNGNAFGRQEQKPQPKASVEGIAHSSDHSVLHRTETVGAPASDAPQQPARPELPPAVEQVVRTVIEKVEAGGGDAKLHLHPAELGEITIHVHADGDHVQVHIHADRPEAAQLIREHTVDLSSMLGQQGLNLADVNVSLGQPGSGNANPGEHQPAPNRPGNSDFAALMGIGDSAATDRFNRVRAAYNPNGAFDYRI